MIRVVFVIMFLFLSLGCVKHTVVTSDASESVSMVEDASVAEDITMFEDTGGTK